MKSKSYQHNSHANLSCKTCFLTFQACVAVICYVHISTLVCKLPSCQLCCNGNLQYESFVYRTETLLQTAEEDFIT